MRVRIKFAKFDTLRFIGHLDIMRTFQKVFNRANLPVKYSEGFHPHQILSFAQPLGLGLTSDGEYLDLELVKELSLDEIKQRVNDACPYGLLATEVSKLRDREANKKLVTSMSLINKAIYAYSFTDLVSCPDDIIDKLSNFTKKDSIKVIKKTKKGEREIDLLPFILEIGIYSDSYNSLYIKKDESNIEEETIKEGIVHAPDSSCNSYIIVKLTAGSETNINPEFFMEEFFKEYNLNFERFPFRIHRVELYGDYEGECIPLCQIP